MTLDDVLAVTQPDGPLALALVLAILGAVDKRRAASVARIGRRTGTNEQDLRLETVRRRQLEAVLRQAGIYLPPWPADDAPSTTTTPPRSERTTMKIPTAPALFSITGLLVVAITVLAALHQPIPDVLITLAVVSASAGAGAATPTIGRKASPPATSGPDLTQLDGLALTNQTAVTAAPALTATNQAPEVTAAPLAAAEPVPVAVPTPRTVPTPGWDHTETFPAITPEQIAADRAQA